MSRLSHRGDPAKLTWALFEFPTEVHGIPGKFTAGVRPDLEASGHVASRSCWCKPARYDHTDAAPLPFFEHRAIASDSARLSARGAEPR